MCNVACTQRNDVKTFRRFAVVVVLVDACRPIETGPAPASVLSILLADQSSPSWNSHRYDVIGTGHGPLQALDSQAYSLAFTGVLHFAHSHK